FSGTQTFGSAGTVVFAGTSTPNQIRATSGTLTIGPSITVRTQSGSGGGTVGDPSFALVNQGTLSAESGGGGLTVNGASWTNSGPRRVNGVQLTLAGNWNNSAGTINVNAGTFALGGTFTTGQLGTLTNTGGTTLLTGVLNNAGTTFTLNGTTGSILMSGGT